MARRLPTVTTTVTTPIGGPQQAAGHADQHAHHPNPHPGTYNAHPTAPQMYRSQHSPAYTQNLQQFAQRLSREAAWHRAHMQYDRAAMGMGGLRYNNLPPQVPAVNTPEASGAQRRTSPVPNADGHRVNATEQGLSDSEVQNILRGADTRQAIQTMTAAMQRSTSGASMGLPQSGRATPNQTSRTPSGSTSSGLSGATEVYILNSPNGPRGLLINNHSETYYTPSLRPTATTTGSSYGLPLPQLRRNVTFTTDTHTPAAAPQQQQHNQPREGQGRVRRRMRVQVHRAGHIPVGVRQNNAGMVALIARLWPHFWLAVRLGLFVWWFTSPTSSWSRWIAVIAIAISIFVLNTGALDGFADQLWRIICRHMENLIPMAGPEAGQALRRDGNQNQNQNQNPNEAEHAAPTQQRGGGGNGENPDPATMAARLVEQRREANGNWLLNRVRRAERAGLLFLASIAPGVAERHIANLEAEAERQRREAEAEAAAEEARRAAESEAAAEAGDEASGAEGSGAAEGEGSSEEENVPQVNVEGPPPPADAPAPQPELIAV